MVTPEALAEHRRRLVAIAGDIYRMRRARDQVLPRGLAGEPAWDMLIALYSEDQEPLPVSSVLYASGVPPTTAFRWVAVLCAQGLVERTRHPRDRRLSLLSLTDHGRSVVEDSLNAILRSARK